MSDNNAPTWGEIVSAVFAYVLTAALFRALILAPYGLTLFWP